MARHISDIQNDLAATRKDLADTLAQLADRTSPAALADEAKTKATTILNDPKVQAALGAAAALLALTITLTLRSKRRRAKEIKEIKALLAAARS